MALATDTKTLLSKITWGVTMIIYLRGPRRATDPKGIAVGSGIDSGAGYGEYTGLVFHTPTNRGPDGGGEASGSGYAFVRRWSRYGRAYSEMTSKPGHGDGYGGCSGHEF